MQKTILRIALILLVFVGLNLSADAQNENYIHYGGPGVVVTTDNSGGGFLGVYNGRYVLKALSESSSIGIATYAGLLLQKGTYVDQFGRQTTANYFAKDAPDLNEYNLGRHSTFEANNRFGLFVGAGLGFSAYQDGDVENETGVGTSFGAVASGGVRVKFLGQSYSFRGSYMKAFSGDDMFGVAMLYGINRNEEIREKGTSNTRSGGGSGYRYRRSSPYRSKRWFRRANRRQRTRIPRGDRSWMRSNRLRN